MVTALFIKRVRFAPLEAVHDFTVNQTGIVGSVPSLPLRQVLILPTITLRRFALQPGDLRENVLVEWDELHALPSGTVLKIGEAKIRLTVHCEPCGRVQPFVSVRAVEHQRGYLGCFFNRGIIRIGDHITILEEKYPAVPYEIPKRIEWHLSTHDGPIASSDLLAAIGLSVSYARALPGYLKKVPQHLASRVLFRSGIGHPSPAHHSQTS